MYAQRSTTAKIILELEALLTQFQELLLSQNNPSTSLASPRSITTEASKVTLDKIAVLLERDAQKWSQVYHRSQIVYKAICELSTEASQDSTKFNTHTTAMSRLEKQVLLNVFRRIFKYLTRGYFLDFF